MNHPSTIIRTKDPFTWTYHICHTGALRVDAESEIPPKRQATATYSVYSKCDTILSNEWEPLNSTKINTTMPECGCRSHFALVSYFMVTPAVANIPCRWNGRENILQPTSRRPWALLHDLHDISQRSNRPRRSSKYNVLGQSIACIVQYAPAKTTWSRTNKRLRHCSSLIGTVQNLVTCLCKAAMGKAGHGNILLTIS